MDPQRWERVKDLFALCEEMTPAEREAALAQEPDEEVRKEAARLLRINPVHALIDNPVMSPEHLDKFTNRAAMLTEGELLGSRYKIERRIASGGMGDVYAAWDKDLREQVAIKTIRPDIIANPAIVARFRREISLARRVSHPNVCRVFDLSREARSSDGRMVDFLTMELVEGETLTQLIKREAPIGFASARPLLEQICAGLAAAHDAGVVHRDFKGSNVLIAKRPDGTLRVAVTDFGLARSVTIEGSTQDSSTGLAGGTPAYMAPEQMEGGTVGPKADLYALGIVMYEMATGTAPHTGDSPLQIAVRRVTERPQSPRQVNPDIDPRWEEAILRCLEYKPESRPADARAVVESFGAERPLFTVPRWKLPRWIGPALAGAAVVAGGMWWWTGRPPEHSEEAMRWYRKGTEALLDGSYSSAKVALEEALKLEPGFGVARARLADTYYELDMPAEARAEIAKAESKDRGERLLIEGTRLALERKIPEALERMDALVASNRSAETLLNRARVLDRGDRMTEAIAAYQAALERDKSLPGALLRLAVLLDATGKKKDAAVYLARADAEYTKLGNLAGRAAVLLEKAKSETKMDAAEELARQAQQLAGQAGSATLQVRAAFAESHYAARKGEWQRAGTLADAALALAKATKQEAAAAGGLKDLAYLHYAKRENKEAIAGYREALDVAERFNAPRRVAEIKRWLGDSLARDGQIEQGMNLIREALGVHQANGEVIEALRDRLILADCESMAERYDLALEGHRSVLAEAQKVPGAEALVIRSRMGVFSGLYIRGEYPEAIALGETALRHYQQSGERAWEMFTRIYYAGSLHRVGRLAEAQAVLAPALEAPGNPYIENAQNEEIDLMVSRGDLVEAIGKCRKRLDMVSAPTEAGNTLTRKLCSIYSLKRELQLAEKWCLPLIPFTKDNSNFAGSLRVAIFNIEVMRGNWGAAAAAARKLQEWADAHRDPEVRLLSHLMAVAASAEDGKKTASPETLSAFQAQRRALESRWGEANVKGMLSSPAFKRYLSLAEPASRSNP